MRAVRIRTAAWVLRDRPPSFGIRPGQVEVHRIPAEVREDIGDTDARANLAVLVECIFPRHGDLAELADIAADLQGRARGVSREDWRR